MYARETCLAVANHLTDPSLFVAPASGGCSGVALSLSLHCRGSTLVATTNTFLVVGLWLCRREPNSKNLRKPIYCKIRGGLHGAPD